MLVTFGLSISVIFTSEPWFILQITCFLCQHPPSFFYCDDNVCVRVYIYCLWSVANDNTRAMHKWGGGGKQVAKVCTWVCAKKYCGTWFIVPSQGTIPGPSLVPGIAGGWGGDIHGLCRSKTLRPRFQPGCWPIHIHVKVVPRVFPPWVDSN